jgi:regulation of enolase protein 1 (concanavalin A-like superfamily)
MNVSKTNKSDLNFSRFFWINQPQQYLVESDNITLYTDPGTDFWQRTYYGFRNDNGHAFVTERTGDFTFSLKTSFTPNMLYDQCGIVLYQDCDNWIKASVEYENNEYSRLGSVVTNLGYSDWGTTDISSEIRTVWYRLSRRGQDFLIEHSKDGVSFFQMRMLHLHLPLTSARIGIYACSPGKSSFKAIFSEFKIGPCLWRAYHED